MNKHKLFFLLKIIALVKISTLKKTFVRFSKQYMVVTETDLSGHL